MRKEYLQKFTQVLLPLLTLIAQFLTASGMPKYGLIFNMLSQPFWLYSSWRAYKDAKQSGILITTIFYIVITTWGIINYWMFAAK